MSARPNTSYGSKPQSLNVSQFNAKYPTEQLPPVELPPAHKVVLAGLSPTYPKVGYPIKPKIKHPLGSLKLPSRSVEMKSMSPHSKPQVSSDLELIRAHAPSQRGKSSRSYRGNQDIDWNMVNESRAGKNSSYTVTELQNIIKDLGGIPEGNKGDLVRQLRGLNPEEPEEDIVSFMRQNQS